MVLACRSVPRGEALAASLRAAAAAEGRPEPHLEVMELDVASLASVRSFAAAWAATGRPLHVLVCNAGIFSMGAPRSQTGDGFEAHIGTNHLGHFLLTVLLMPALRQGAEELGRPARVVNVTSRMHLMGRLRREDPHVTQGYNSVAAYAQSKLAQVSSAGELGRRGGGAVRAVAVHPGEVTTDVVRSLPSVVRKLYGIVMGAILLVPPEGARSSVYAATSPDLDEPRLADVAYFDSNCAPGACAREARDPEAAAWLWRWSAETVGLGAADDLPPGP